MMNIEAISKILPQKFPFLMVDKVLIVEAGKRVVAIKNVSINEDFFRGHFFGKPIMPGSLIIEAMAQSAILLHATTASHDPNRKVGYYLGSVKAHFSRPVVPGDQLRLEAVMVKAMPKGLYVQTKAFVDKEQVAESDLVCMVEK
jgi:3-hydroxyacyl-[acyl-carrier-protein] dehydratase